MNLRLFILLITIGLCQANLFNVPRIAIRLTKEFTGMEVLKAPEEVRGEDYEIKIDTVFEVQDFEEDSDEKEDAFLPDLKLKSPFDEKTAHKSLSMLNENHEVPRAEIVYPEDFNEHVIEILDSRNERNIDMEPVILANLEQGYFDSNADDSSSDSSSSSESSSESESDSDEEEDAEWDEARPYLKCGCLKKSGKVFESKTAPRVWEAAEFTGNDLPAAWDWRNVSGKNYCSPTRNQHIPVYCGSCWVFGTTGALNDRFNVAREGRWPMTQVSPQEIIDCNGKGSCQGGEIGDVLEHAKIKGLVEEGCNVYRAVNGECNPFHRCGSCWPNACFSLTNYTRYYVKDYGTVKGRENIMSEIKKGGPIACAIGATKKFEYEYVKGVYSEKSDLESNHIISLTGWGVDENGVEYWIARNSWGEAWGELGWFRVVTSKFNNGQGDQYNMGIERDCYYADVDVSNLN
uniref:cathepsin X n=1 Tax=Caenorhabditis japonica TaxID=281687 RepID=A0A8R1E334_CAEJA